MQVNRFNCGALKNAGMLQDWREKNEKWSRDAERETGSRTESCTFPEAVSIVDCGVIVLLLAADKPLEESGLLWILSGGRQTGSVGSTGQPGGFFFGHCSFSSLSLHQQDDTAREETAEAADRDRHQHLSVITCTCSWPDALICSRSQHWECMGSEFRWSQWKENQWLWRRRSARWASQDLCVCFSAVCGSIKHFSDSLLSSHFKF